MKKVRFTYKGKTYQGLVAISCEEYPHFYWFYPDDPKLTRELGECLSFKVEWNGSLEATESYPPQLMELVEAIRTALEPYRLASDRSVGEHEL